MTERRRSRDIFAKALGCIPGGVNSPVRAFRAVGLRPLVIRSGRGSKLYDADGNEYIDYVGSWGPLIMGHARAEVVDAVCRAAQRGTSYGFTTELEVELAQMICEAVPSIEKVRMVNSGTEATMSAMRLARAYTGRNRVIKFEGCYHGHGDAFLIRGGSGMLTAGVPTSPGVSEATAGETLVAQYNSLETVEELFGQAGPDIAAVIVEPVAGNMGLVPPDNGFLEGLRQLTSAHGSLLVFDEVITGFRAAYGGYQTVAGIDPDLTTLGKVIGGGLPVGAYGGRRDIMEMVAPEGAVYQAGTLSGNPLAMAAGIETLTLLQKTDCYERLERMGALLAERIRNALKQRGLGYCVNHLGSMFSIFLTEKEVVDYKTVMQCDTEAFALFYNELLQQGVCFPPSQFETCFVSCAHDQDDIEKTVCAIEMGFDRIAGR